MDIRYVNPFIGAVRHLFKTMLNTDIIFSKPTIKNTNSLTPDIATVINFTGSADGRVALCFQTRPAVQIASKFAGAKIPANSEDLADALGELTNIVVGKVKASIGDLQINISLPEVLNGKDNQSPYSTTTPALILPCDSQLGRFWVEISMTGAEEPVS